MINLPIEGVVFDVDGVLFDTERLMHQVWLEVGTEMGWPQVGDLYLDIVGQNRTDICVKMDRLFGPEFPKDEFLVRCSERGQEWMERDGVPLKPGVREIMDFLQASNIPIALATSTVMERTKRRMELTNLTHYFQAMITGDQVLHSKPDPEIYLLACKALGTDPRRTIAVEDSHNGIRSASAAEMPIVMVPDMVAPTEELDALLWKRCSSLVELRQELEAIL